MIHHAVSAFEPPQRPQRQLAADGIVEVVRHVGNGAVVKHPVPAHEGIALGADRPIGMIRVTRIDGKESVVVERRHAGVVAGVGRYRGSIIRVIRFELAFRQIHRVAQDGRKTPVAVAALVELRIQIVVFRPGIIGRRVGVQLLLREGYVRPLHGVLAHRRSVPRVEIRRLRGASAVDHAAVGVDLHHILQDVQPRIEHHVVVRHGGRRKIKAGPLAGLVGVPALELVAFLYRIGVIVVFARQRVGKRLLEVIGIRDRPVLVHEGQRVLLGTVEEIDMVILLPGDIRVGPLDGIVTAVDQVVSVQIPAQLILRIKVGDDR